MSGFGSERMLDSRKYYFSDGDESIHSSSSLGIALPPLSPSLVDETFKHRSTDSNDESDGRGGDDTDDTESEGEEGERPPKMLKISNSEDDEEDASSKTSEQGDLDSDDEKEMNEESDIEGGDGAVEKGGKDATSTKKDVGVQVATGAEKKGKEGAVTYTVDATTVMNHTHATPTTMLKFLRKDLERHAPNDPRTVKPKVVQNDDLSYKKCHFRITCKRSKRELHGHLMAYLKSVGLGRTVGVYHIRGRGRTYQLRMKKGHKKAEGEKEPVDYTINLDNVVKSELVSKLEGLEECMAAKLDADVSAVETTAIHIECNTFIKKAETKRIVHDYLKKHKLSKDLKISAAQNDSNAYDLHERMNEEE